MTKQTGVFLCQCRDNISSKIDMDSLQSALINLHGVDFVEVHPLLCAPDGRAFMVEKLAEYGGTHTVVAACSPKEHEMTFQRVLSESGRNKYLLQMANIREHVAWVTDDPEAALKKALALTKAAIHRVTLHEALEEKEIEVNPDVLVIGGGVAGMEAALLASGAGRRVTLVEKSASVGGRPTQYEEVSPNMECAPCMLAPRIDALANAENVEILTCSHVSEVFGFLGNFEARVEKQARLVDTELCLGCDECIHACPVFVTSEYQHGLGTRKAIYVPFPGAEPNAAVIDRDACVRFNAESCTACADACPLEAVDFTQEDETLEIKVGTIVVATGFDTYDPRKDNRWSMAADAEVYTLPQLERLTSNHGPTGGQIAMKNGEVPQRIAVVHCVGRNELGYCSAICCQSSLKTARLLKGCSGDKTGATEVVHLITDLIIPGKRGEALLQNAMSNGARIVRTTGPGDMRIEKTANGPRIQYRDAGGNEHRIIVDMAVLATGMVPSEGTGAMIRKLDLAADEAGFIAPDHAVLRPSEASLEGVFVAGCAAGPGDIPTAVQDAKAAMGTALARVQPGKKMSVEPLVAEAIDEQCSRCMVCVSVCPYRAAQYDKESDMVVVSDVLCRGCGTCVAGCAGGAARARQFTDDQLNAEIEEALNG